MPSKSKTINPDKKTAMQTFNDAWKYLDKKKLSKEEKITLLNLVHTSYYLWQQVPECNATNTSISLWQISKAYAHIGDGTCALLFAVQNIKHSKTKKTDGFYIAYAYESAARAYWIKNKDKFFVIKTTKAQFHYRTLLFLLSFCCYLCLDRAGFSFAVFGSLQFFSNRCICLVRSQCLCLCKK